jgi:hypothetical protein
MLLAWNSKNFIPCSILVATAMKKTLKNNLLVKKKETA